ncbi:hypothetical protein LguiA_018519 [Lonicera macranthoides]
MMNKKIAVIVVLIIEVIVSEGRGFDDYVPVFADGFESEEGFYWELEEDLQN